MSGIPREYFYKPAWEDYDVVDRARKNQTEEEIKRSKRNGIKITCLVLALLLMTMAMVLVLVYLGQRKILYAPVKKLDKKPTEWGLPYLDIQVETTDHVTLHGWLISKEMSSTFTRPTVVFYHGAFGNISFSLRRIWFLLDAVDCNVLLVGYRGYGQSSDVSINEAGLMTDSLRWIRWIQEITEGQQYIDLNRGLILYGTSLGSAIALKTTFLLQSLGEGGIIAGIVLENPFTSIPDLVARHTTKLFKSFSFDKFENDKIVGKLHNVPVLILIGEKDDIVPPSMGKTLFKLCASSRKSMRLFPEGDHYQTYLQPEYYNYVSAFIRNICNKPGDSTSLSFNQ